MRNSDRLGRLPSFTPLWMVGILCGVVLVLSTPVFGSVVETIDRVEPKMVKIYGAGGVRGMANYQSGILISPEGHVLTAFSHVLDTDEITVVLSDGQRFVAKLLGADPRLEIAVLKIEPGVKLPCFNLADAVKLDAGSRILALSNIFGVAAGSEPVSVQKGTVSVVAQLEARRGAFATPYHGPVYVLDVTTNNSGAAGGALVTRRGELAAMLGKELRNAQNNAWLNYAIPIAELQKSVDEIRAGTFVATLEEDSERRPSRSLDLESLGIVLIPDVLERTPPYVDHVRSDSLAAAAGVLPDDLIVLVNDRLVQSCKILDSALEWIDHEDPVHFTVLRGHEMVDFTLQKDAAMPTKDQ